MSKTPTAIASSSSRKSRRAGEPLRALRWLDAIPLVPLIVAAAALAISPPLAEPHLWQKLRMLASGQAWRPLDAVDFALHGILPVILFLKLLRRRALARGGPR